MEHQLIKKEADLTASLKGKSVFDYLQEYHLLEYYDLDNEQDLNTLCSDFNEYAETNCSKEDFLFAARYYQKTISRPKFSFFRKPISNIFPYRTITINQLFEVVVDPKYYQSVTNELRCFKDESKAKAFKATHFDYVTFSGSFSKRSASGLLLHSGLMVVDIDHISDVEKVKTNLLNDDGIETEMLFVSPGGHGLKWVINSFPEKFDHLYFFQGVSAYLKKRYAIENDPSGKDVSRACFICYDPDAFINPKYL